MQSGLSSFILSVFFLHFVFIFLSFVLAFFFHSFFLSFYLSLSQSLIALFRDQFYILMAYTTGSTIMFLLCLSRELLPLDLYYALWVNITYLSIQGTEGEDRLIGRGGKERVSSWTRTVVRQFAFFSAILLFYSAI